MKQFASLIFISALAGLSLIAAAVAQVPEPPEPTEVEEVGPVASPGSDAVFTEILLDEAGVVAYDSMGNRWVYDFERDLFIQTDEPRDGEEPGDGEEIILPVEERCTERLSLKELQNTVLVGYEEYVPGNVIAYSRVTVKGWVQGNVTSYSGTVLVTESGQVDGDIRAPTIIVKEGGVVTGETVITEPLDISVDALRRSFSAAGVWIMLGFTLLFVLAGFVAETLMPRQLRNVEDCLTRHKSKAFFLGLLFVLLLPVITTLLTITIVGILVVPLVPLAYVMTLTFGMIAAGVRVDRMIFKKKQRGESLIFPGMLGILLFMLVWMVVAVLLGSSSGVANGFGIFLLVVAILVTSYTFLVGTGAAVMTRFGFRRYFEYGERERDDSGPAPAPAPPPIPNAPPMASPPTPPSTGSPRREPEPPRQAGGGRDDSDDEGPLPSKRTE